MKRRVGLVLILVAIMLTASRPEGQSRGMGRMNGTVVDEGGAPLPGVTVKTSTSDGAPIEIKSDDGGRWIMGGLGRGEWQVLFAKEGFIARSVKVVLERELERTEPIKIVLKKG
jgi:hypothetical protein